MFCPKCGKETPKGSSFCPSCGANLASGGPFTDEAHGRRLDGGPALVRKLHLKKPTAIAIAAAIVLVAIVGGISVVGALTAPEEEPPRSARQDGADAEGALAGGSDGVAGQDDADTEASVGDLAVSDVTVADEEGLGWCIKFTVTNDADEACYADFYVTGDFEVVDGYGESTATQLGLYALICWEPRDGYLKPGDNKVTLIPVNDDGVIAGRGEYGGDEDLQQDFRLDDASNVAVKAVRDHSNGARKGRILTSEEYDVNIEVLADGSPRGTITNNTEKRWDGAWVILRLTDSRGTPLQYSLYNVVRGDAKYVEPGETAELDFPSWPGGSDKNNMHVEVDHVIVKEGD